MDIKTARQSARLAQREMSERLEIPIRTIEDWERGVRTPPPYVEKLIIEELKRIKTNDEIK